MTRVVVVFLVGVVAGSLGMRLHAQRMERLEPPAVLATPTSAGPTKAAEIAEARKRTAAAEPEAMNTRPQSRSRSERLESRTHAETEIPLTEAHEPLMNSTYDGRTLGELHEKLEQEPKQHWSYEREQQLTEFFTPPHGEVVFDVHSIECRTSMCEIQAIALGPTAENTVMEDLQRLPWWDFSRSFTEFGEHNGTTSVLMYLMRDG